MLCCSVCVYTYREEERQRELERQQRELERLEREKKEFEAAKMRRKVCFRVCVMLSTCTCIVYMVLGKLVVHMQYCAMPL